MTIDWLHFTPWRALLGGSLIGLAASFLILFNGRVLGISGILGGLHQAKSGWRFAFAIGVLLAPLVYAFFSTLPPIDIRNGPVILLLAGLLVGFGTRLGSGCTSGHGICGLARRSPRSLAAVGVFMASGFAIVYLMRHAAL